MTTPTNNEFSLSIILVIVWLALVGMIYLSLPAMLEDEYAGNRQRTDQDDIAGLQARIRPVMTLQDIIAAGEQAQPAETTAAAAPAGQSAGQLYAGACSACHDSGAAGAPRLGDDGAWQPRAALGMDALVAIVVSGKGAMPPNGGSTYSQKEIGVVVAYMLEQAGLLESASAASPQPVPATGQEPGQPVADAADIPQPTTASSDYLAAGERAYRGACFACHDSGAAGAPRLGDVAAWAPRMANGLDALVQAVINGKGAMPPKGGAMYLTTEEIVNIVAYMLEMSS